MSTKRFANISDADLQKLRDDKDSQSTQRIVKRSVKLFRDFLGVDADFESFPKEKLDDKLKLFYASVRTKGGSDLKTSTLYNVKYGLAKYLKESCKIDVQKDVAFAESNEILRAKATDLKKKGQGSVEHKPPISESDLKKLYHQDNVAFNTNTPCGLQKKVWFDLMYYLCRRGRENLRQMMKSTFTVRKDASGMEYVCQVIDEADKNHGVGSAPDDTIGEARMYERPGDAMCPVLSFKKYLDKLHPGIPDLWQRPLDTYDENACTWYCKSPLGKNTLASMMSEISKLSQLSLVYTNHCIRATSITTLDNAGVEARHIMRASGHRNESSIRSYSCRLSENKTREMSHSLSNALECNQNAVGSSSDIPDNVFGTSGDIPEISNEEMNLIFSDENALVELPVNTVPVSDSSVPAVKSCEKISSNFSREFFQVNPTLNNCVVTFNFYSNKEN